eukprot:2014112-Pyramimonas_sp.AAC.1
MTTHRKKDSRTPQFLAFLNPRRKCYIAWLRTQSKVCPDIISNHGWRCQSGAGEMDEETIENQGWARRG